MLEPKVTEEVTYSTVETCKKSTTTNKRILRNTWRGNAVQVNSYDSEGRLRDTETDKQTYQDTDTEYYTWTDKDPPPKIPAPDYATQVEPFGSNSLHTTTQMSSDGNVFVVKSTEVSSTPIIHWTGESGKSFKISEQPPQDIKMNSKEVRNQVEVYTGARNGPEYPGGEVTVTNTMQRGPETHETEYKMAEHMDGSKWSKTEETVWLTSKKRSNEQQAIRESGQQHEAAIKSATPTKNGDLSLEERKQMRRNAARQLTASRGNH